MKLRVGLIGLGDAWEQRYRPALRALADRFEVRVVFDQIGHRAKTAAGEFGAQAVDGYRAVTMREDIDAVLMLSPQWYGAVPALAACDGGKAVYLGAGFPLEPAQAETIRERVEKAGVAFTTEKLRRQSPATLRLKELIATRLGPPRLVFCHYRLPISRSDGRAGAGRPPRSVQQELVDQVDWCRYVVGRDPRWVTGIRHDGRDPAESDYQMMSLDFSDASTPGAGPLAQISCGRYFPASWQEAVTYRLQAALQVCCENGIAFVDPPSTLVWFDDAGRHQESLESERPLGEQLLTQFFRAVTSLVRRTSDLFDTCRALAIVDAASRSAATGQRMEVA